jgi:hypothetical protein
MFKAVGQALPYFYCDGLAKSHVGFEPVWKGVWLYFVDLRGATRNPG